MLPSHKGILPLSNEQSLTCFGHQEYSCTTRKGKVYFFDLLRKFIRASLGWLVFYLVGHKASSRVGQAMEPKVPLCCKEEKVVEIVAYCSNGYWWKVSLPKAALVFMGTYSNIQIPSIKWNKQHYLMNLPACGSPSHIPALFYWSHPGGTDKPCAGPQPSFYPPA